MYPSPAQMASLIDPNISHRSGGVNTDHNYGDKLLYNIPDFPVLSP